MRFDKEKANMITKKFQWTLLFVCFATLPSLTFAQDGLSTGNTA